MTTSGRLTAMSRRWTTTSRRSMTMSERKLRQDLEATKSKLFSKANGQESIVSMTDYHDLQEKYNNLQQKMTELKDSKIYILEKTLDDHKEISDKYDLSQGMLNEKTSIIMELQEKLANLKLGNIQY